MNLQAIASFVCFWVLSHVGVSDSSSSGSTSQLAASSSSSSSSVPFVSPLSSNGGLLSNPITRVIRQVQQPQLLAIPPCLPAWSRLGFRGCPEARRFLVLSPNGDLNTIRKNIDDNSEENTQQYSRDGSYEDETNVDSQLQQRSLPFLVERRQDLPPNDNGIDDDDQIEQLRRALESQSRLYDDRLSVTSRPVRVRTQPNQQGSNSPSFQISPPPTSPTVAPKSSTHLTSSSRSSSSALAAATQPLGRRYTRPMPGVLKCIQNCVSRGNLHPIQCHSIC